MTEREAFRRQLYSESEETQRCPHLKLDGGGSPMCGSPGITSGEGHLVTDHFSLQLWCLDGEERYTKCLWFRKKRLASTQV